MGTNTNGIKPYQFKPGESGNLEGKPKGIPHSKTRLLRLLKITRNLKNPITKTIEGFSVAEQMDLKQIMKALKGDSAAYSILLDRLEGKPNQSTTLDGSVTFQLIRPSDPKKDAEHKD